MKRVLVLGGNGMLGSALVRWFSTQPDFEVSATTRTGTAPRGLSVPGSRVRWLPLCAERAGFDELAHLGEGFDLVINAIGRIKQRINETSLADRESTLRVNTLFSLVLAQAAEASGAKVVQIATDCVYSGERGQYLEADRHDATDLYGLSKSLGEVVSPNVVNLRCSIIGLELASSYSLLNWFLAQPRNASIQGYANHLWNGITALHFAKICAGLLRLEWDALGSTNVVPADSVSKCQLLELFARTFQRNDVRIIPTEAPQRVDRTLATGNPDLNARLWQAAGYPSLPSINDLIEELARNANC